MPAESICWSHGCWSTLFLMMGLVICDKHSERDEARLTKMIKEYVIHGMAVRHEFCVQCEYLEVHITGSGVPKV